MYNELSFSVYAECRGCGQYLDGVYIKKEASNEKYVVISTPPCAICLEYAEDQVEEEIFKNGKRSNCKKISEETA